MQLTLLSRKHHSFFVFYLNHPQPRSTLFPYTTLFRSRRRGNAGKGQVHRSRLDQSKRAEITQPGHERGEVDRNQDRKSTRLNSSHMSISYAVFCLKKKKNLLIQ